MGNCEFLIMNNEWGRRCEDVRIACPEPAEG
jgi:hypothetical protein